MWIEPKTDWSGGDFFTLEDWDRIIYDTYHLTQADVDITLEHGYEYLFDNTQGWQTVIDALWARAEEFGLDDDLTKPNDEMTADNMNDLEMLLFKIKEYQDILDRQEQSRIYVGQDIYVAHAGQYTDVSEEYVRD